MIGPNSPSNALCNGLQLQTPAFIYDEHKLLEMARLLRQAGNLGGYQVLYSIKALPFLPVLELLLPWLDGFSVSSLYEARLAAPFKNPLHITTPGLRQGEMAEISHLCRFVAFNSLEQFRRLAPLAGNTASLGLRINPGLSFLPDRRYDPCRKHSKLGVPLPDLADAWKLEKGLRHKIKGLHFHTAFASQSFAPLRGTLAVIEASLGADCLANLDWINLGGGYVFEDANDLADLTMLASDLRSRFGLSVHFEPGKALAGRVGYLATSVIDRFRRDGQWILVMDTSINHHPEVFEYQTRPQPAWREPERGESAILAGSTCLAGDLFGEFRFERLPEVGECLVFAGMGAYSLSKANRFNGYELPSIYAWDGEKTACLMKRHRYEGYLSLWTADN